MDPLYPAILLLYGVILAGISPVYLGMALFQRERYQSALRCFLWLHKLAPLLPQWRGPAANYLAACYTQLGEYELAQSYAEEAVEENSKRNHPKFLLSSQMYLGVLLSRQGHYAQAEKLFDEALSAPMSQPALRRWVEVHAANTYILRGRYEDAERLLLGVLTEKQSRPDLLAGAHCILGICCYLKNDLAAALENTRLAREIPRTSGWANVMALSGMLLYLAEMGDVEQGRRIEAELRPLLAGAPTHLHQRALLAIGGLALAVNDLDRARDYADRAARADANPNGQAAALLIQAEVFAARQNRHRAMTLCDVILQSNTIDFYKAKAESLRQKLMEPIAQTAIANRYQTVQAGDEISVTPELRVQPW